MAGARLAVDFNQGFALRRGRVSTTLRAAGDPFIPLRVNAGFSSPSTGYAIRGGGGRLVGEAATSWISARRSGLALATIESRALGSGPRTLAGDNFILTLSYADGSLGTIAYTASGSQRWKERVEVIGADRSAVIDDFRVLELDGARVEWRTRRDKGHPSTVAAAFRFFRAGGEPPIPYARLVETTQATLVARDALARGDAAPQQVRLT